MDRAAYGERPGEESSALSVGAFPALRPISRILQRNSTLKLCPRLLTSQTVDLVDGLCGELRDFPGVQLPDLPIHMIMYAQTTRPSGHMERASTRHKLRGSSSAVKLCAC